MLGNFCRLPLPNELTVITKALHFEINSDLPPALFGGSSDD
jgi:hypothetical protein